MRTKKRMVAGCLLVEQVERALRSRLSEMLATDDRSPLMERDLAAEYGVSQRTVRTALANIKRDNLVRSIPGKGTFVVPETRKQKGRTLLLCKELQHPFESMAVETFMTLLRERGLPPAMATVCGRDLPAPPPQWQLEDTDSVVLIGDVGRRLMETLSATRLKALVMVGDLSEPVRLPPVCDHVIPDTRAGVFLATQHLLAAGHRRILLAGWVSGAWGQEMRRGYLEAMQHAGLAPDSQLVLDIPPVNLNAKDCDNSHWLEDLGVSKQRIEKLLSSSKAPTALIHNSALERQLQEMSQTYFHGHFPADAVVGINYLEHLSSSYRGIGNAWSSAIPLRTLAELALTLLDAPHTQGHHPVRHILDHYRIVRRENQSWNV